RAIACAPGTSIRRRIRACRVTCAAMSAWSNACTARMCFPTVPRWARARTHSGCTRSASTAATCGVRTPIRRCGSRSTRSSPISTRPDMASDMAIDPAAARRAREAVPGIPCDAEGPVFREPWEAQAFAMTLALHERGLFTWPQWAATLGDEIRRAQAAGDPDTGETYYRHWLNALERMVAAKELADAQMLARYRD